jgi:hypothetical protein
MPLVGVGGNDALTQPLARRFRSDASVEGILQVDELLPIVG